MDGLDGAVSRVARDARKRDATGETACLATILDFARALASRGRHLQNYNRLLTPSPSECLPEYLCLILFAIGHQLPPRVNHTQTEDHESSISHLQDKQKTTFYIVDAYQLPLSSISVHSAPNGYSPVVSSILFVSLSNHFFIDLNSETRPVPYCYAAIFDVEELRILHVGPAESQSRNSTLSPNLHGKGFGGIYMRSASLVA